ncbi:MAG TPA: Na+/H+ antiporter [Xanthobacteraceae bacterium]|nr:Na+/H+ antiporter [Xanthobacteraceae bacterium]
MEAVATVLVLMVAVVMSAISARLLPKVPLPLLQIVIGALLSYAGFNVRLDPEIFFLLFIPPLLFLDGWRIPKGAFFNDWRAILTLALGLVVFTVLGVGLLIDTMIPAMPLAVAFALAAILSPTDPVAVTAITRGAPIPSRLMHILEGEALLNDASGLVCFRFAVAAALTGTFSLSEASIGFLSAATGGVLAGVAIAWTAAATYHWLSRKIGGEPGTEILIGILIPFAAYMAAEHLHASGILAAAAAGIAMHYADLMGRTLAVTRMQRSAIWDMLQATLNGAMFVVLGEQLPGVLARVPEISTSIHVGNPWRLAAYAVVITLALPAMRFLWIAAWLITTRLFAPRHGRARRRPRLRFLFVAALAGVRGAITLAGIFTLPWAMPDGAPFPARDLAIFLAMSVILLSLLMASIGLPLLTKGLPLTDELQPSDQETDARIAGAEAAIRGLEQARALPAAGDPQAWAEATANVIDAYRRRLSFGHADGDEAEHMKRIAEAEQRLRIIALRAERDEYYRLRRSREIDDPLHRRLVREVDLEEASLSSSLHRNS